MKEEELSANHWLSVVYKERSHYMINRPLSSSSTVLAMEKKSTTDVFMSIPPEDALEIARGRKTNVYRSYPLPATVRRIWFYTTAPLQYIEYVVCISQDGAGSNTGSKQFIYGYKIRQVWMLKQPIYLHQAISRGILKAPPRKYCWATESFLDSCPFYRHYPVRGPKEIVW